MVIIGLVILFWIKRPSNSRLASFKEIFKMDKRRKKLREFDDDDFRGWCEAVARQYNVDLPENEMTWMSYLEDVLDTDVMSMYWMSKMQPPQTAV
jgi:hypothetical protein